MRTVLKRIRTGMPVFLLILSFLPCFAMPAGATGDLITVKVGFFEFGGMFEGAAEGAPKGGYCYEYMMEVATYTGWNYEFVYGTYSELYEKLVNGEIDILPYTNYNSQRGQTVLFSDQVLAQEEYYIAVRSDQPASIEALNGKTISTLEGADYNSLLLDYAVKNSLDLDVRYYPSLEETWQAIRTGDADATVFTSNAYMAEGYDCLVSFGMKPTYIAVNRNRQDLLNKLNEATKLIGEESPALLGQLYAKYFMDNPMWHTMTPEEQQWLEAHPVLRVGGFSDNATDLEIVDGKATGLTVDLIDGIIRKLNLDATAEYRYYNTTDEMRQALETGEIDVFYPFYPSYSIAQQKDLIISKTVREANMELVFRTGTSYREAISDIASPTIRIGIYYIRDCFPDSRIVEATSVADAVNKVRSGEARGAIAYNQAIQKEKNKYGDLDSIHLIEGCGTCFAARPENHALIMVLNRGLNYFGNSEISALSSKYFINPKVSVIEFLQTHREIDLLVIIILLSLAALAFMTVQQSRLKKKADEANRTKTAFLFNMSHDIRTPMNAILGYTDIGLRHIGDPKTTEDSYRKIKTAGGHLLSLINDVLEMSRIESGALELYDAPMDMRRTIEGVTHMSKALALPKSIDFETEIGELKNPYIYADELHGNEIFINLISNAIKYTPEGGRVRYRIRQISDVTEGKVTYRFEVSDNGIGMSEEFQRHLFEAFSREKTSTVSRVEGTGLGLSIVKKIVDLYGGTIRVRSKLKEGSVFTVELPFRVMDQAAIDAFRATHQPEQLHPESLNLEGKKVLLVDDNEMNREIASDLMRDAGLTVEMAEDGEIALKTVIDRGTGYYDFILMDIQMPVMNGYETTKAIRSLPNGDRVPIIALSANAFEEDRKKSLEAGMNAHISKPIDVKTLFETICGLISTER